MKALPIIAIVAAGIFFLSRKGGSKPDPKSGPRSGTPTPGLNPGKRFPGGAQVGAKRGGGAQVGGKRGGNGAPDAPPPTEDIFSTVEGNFVPARVGALNTVW